MTRARPVFRNLNKVQVAIPYVIVQECGALRAGSQPYLLISWQSQTLAAMAYENYVRDLSYLTSGDLSDLTLNFSDKSWRIHKALMVCHSKWFQKALTGGLVVVHCDRSISKA